MLIALSPGATRLAAIAFGSTLNVAMRLDESLSIEEARRKLASLQVGLVKPLDDLSFLEDLEQ